MQLMRLLMLCVAVSLFAVAGGCQAETENTPETIEAADEHADHEHADGDHDHDHEEGDHDHAE